MKKRFSIGTKYKYCPNGNYWQDISGIFDREIFLYCDCNKCNGQVYVLRARKFKLEESRLKELVSDLKRQSKLNETREMITASNMDKVKSFLEQEGSHE